MIFILQIIKQRIWRHTYQEGLVWNSDPGALLTLPEFSDSLSHFPFHFGEEQQQLKAPNAAAATGCEKFTAVIYTTLTSASTSSKVASGVHLSAPIFKLARNVAASNFAQQVINFKILNSHFWWVSHTDAKSHFLSFFSKIFILATNHKKVEM